MKKAAIDDNMTTSEDKSDKDEIKNLNEKLQKAVAEERYEDAARIRDTIHELQKKLKLKKK